MKKLAILLTGVLLFMTSCSTNVNQDEEVVKKENETANQEKSIVPTYQLSKNNYKMILPYKPNAARGLIVERVGSRLDIDEMEVGLRRHSKAYFDPGKYYFQAGQKLSADTVKQWLSRELTDQQLKENVADDIKDLEEAEMTVNKDQIIASYKGGLNPTLKDDAGKGDYRSNPRYLTHILEQDFLEKNKGNEVELAGMSIGLAMKSEYKFQPVDDGPYFYEEISDEEMLKQGKQMAQTILKRIRKMEGLKNIPIAFSIFREESESSPVPGNYVAKTMVKGGGMSIGDWNKIAEEFILFPSDQAVENYYDDSVLVKSFTDELAKFFPNYVGVIGKGFYIDDDLKKLTLDIPIEFYGQGEVIGFTQYAYGLIKEMFPDYFELELKVTSTEKLESIIYRSAGVKDPTVHIFQ